MQNNGAIPRIEWLKTAYKSKIHAVYTLFCVSAQKFVIIAIKLAASMIVFHFIAFPLRAHIVFDIQIVRLSSHLAITSLLVSSIQ